MTADEFLAWTETLADDTRYELLRGEPIAMAPERVLHAEIKFYVARRLAEAVERNRLPCQVLIDGVGVRIGPRTLYVPDVLLRCGGMLDPDQQEVNDPLAIVEVLSPSTGQIDLQQKLIDYFALPSLVHYLIVSPVQRTTSHHQRRPDGVIETRLLGATASVALDPPGLLAGSLFPPEKP